MAGWTAIRTDDDALLVPFHADLPDDWHADGATCLRPGERGYDTHLAAAINARDLHGDRARDEALIAGWEARDPGNAVGRTA